LPIIDKDVKNLSAWKIHRKSQKVGLVV